MSIPLLHSCSGLCAKSDLEIFDLPSTQFSHESECFLEFHPTSLSENIEFRIPNNGESYIDPNAIFLNVKARIVRSDGAATVELPVKTEDWDKGATPAAVPDKVYPTENFLSSMFSYCDVELGGKQINLHELYAYRSYVNLLLRSTRTQRANFWPLMFELDEPGQSLNLNDKRGITKRYERTKGSKIFELEGPLFTDLSEQDNLLIPGVDLRIVFQQAKDAFRLMRGPTETRSYKLEILKFKLRVRFVKIAPSVRLNHEEALLKKPAVYLLRGTETRIRPLPVGSSDLILEDICRKRVPARITVFFVSTDGFYGQISKNPFKMEHLNIKKCSLFVGTQEYRDEFDFSRDFYSTAFVNLCRAVGDPNVEISPERYASSAFMLHYVLTGDGRTDNLSPVKYDNVRLSVELQEPLTEPFTCIILTESPRVLSINKAREVQLS